jgi:hypothetical protein
MIDKIAQRYMLVLQLKYKAQMEEALANLDLYFSDRLTAIGEHSNLIEEHDKWLDVYANAKGKLEALEENYISKIINKI